MRYLALPVSAQAAMAQGCMEAGGQASPPLAWDCIVLSLNQGPLGLQVAYPDTHKGASPSYN